jgi:hypothetical protein
MVVVCHPWSTSSLPYLGPSATMSLQATNSSSWFLATKSSEFPSATHLTLQSLKVILTRLFSRPTAAQFYKHPAMPLGIVNQVPRGIIINTRGGPIILHAILDTIGRIFDPPQSAPLQESSSETMAELQRTFEELRAIQNRMSAFLQTFDQVLRAAIDGGPLPGDISAVLGDVRTSLLTTAGDGRRLRRYRLNKLERNDIPEDVVERVAASGKIDTCPICYEDTPNPVINMQCGHMMCRECVQKILEIGGNAARCPECRGRLACYTFWEPFCRVFCAEKLEGVDLVGFPKELLDEIEKR